MEALPLHATKKARIVCPSKAKKPYAEVIRELSLRAGVPVDFVKKLEGLENPILLDERGEPLTPEKLGELLAAGPVFVVGGPDGFPEPAPPGPKYSLCPCTLNHQIAIIVLLDLIFRAKNPNHPYNQH